MLGFLTMNDKLENGIPLVTYYAFFVGAAASLITILITVLTTSEIPPSEAEEKQLKEQKKEGRIIQRTWNDIVGALYEMPTPMKQLIPVMFFHGMQCFVIGNTSLHVYLYLYTILQIKHPHISHKPSY